MSREARIREILTQALAPLHLEVENESHMHSVPANSETHFKVLVVSPQFEGKSRIDRQRLVNELLATELRSGLHALTQRALTPQEWDQQRAKMAFESPECLGGSKHDKK
ncbi:BolA family protein [Bdellovibrio sp. 22V]|uniref:BolA family protein n=1 Tax=Bdellovibrio TaxID=958 RepID=UPI0025434C48|nr:BolA family protein [Bdellovibrio sp. 22V]WII71438.1 BolA family protein [Bdellovibrio sp. 22V]